MAKKDSTPARIDESNSGRFIAASLALAAAAVVILYLADALAEAAVGSLFAGAVGLGVAFYLMNSLGSSVQTTAARAAVIALVVVTGFLAVAPVMLSIFPGPMLSRGEVKAVGDALPLPADVSGPVRLLIHGGISGEGTSRLDFTFAGGDRPIVGKLERSTSNVRVGRRGHATVSHERNTEFVEGWISKGQSTLTLDALEGPASGALEVQIYHDYLPVVPDVAAAIVLLVLLSLLAVRLEASSGVVAAAGTALFFGVMGYQFVTPGSVVRPEVGALIMGGLVGISAGGSIGWIVRKAVGMFAPRPSKTRAAT
jgi:hypothetical protein